MKETVLDVLDRIIVIVGDITCLEVDGIVNAANSSLLGGGGVDGAIHRAGGSAILAACQKIRESDYPQGLPAGEAVITTSGNLSHHGIKGVIHTVGPIYKKESKEVEKLLKNGYRNSLQIASDKKFRSLAFPAISTGVYGYPKPLAADIAFSTITSFLSDNSYPEQVYLVFFSQKDKDIFLEAVPDLKNR